MQPVQSREIEIASVDDIVASRRHRDLVERCDFVPFALVDAGENWNAVAQIEQHVELHGSQRLFPPCPREQRQAQFDHGRIQGEQVRLQAQCGRCLGIESLRPAHQHRRHLGKNPPVPMLGNDNYFSPAWGGLIVAGGDARLRMPDSCGSHDRGCPSGRRAQRVFANRLRSPASSRDTSTDRRPLRQNDRRRSTLAMPAASEIGPPHAPARWRPARQESERRPSERDSSPGQHGQDLGF